MSRNGFIVLLSTLILTFGVCYAKTGEQTALSQQDREFANEAAHVNQAEMKLANVAEQRATNSALKQFGTLMSQDHTKAWNALQSWAKESNFTLPNQPDSEQASTIQQLSKQSGQLFDQEFVRDELEGHKGAIADFEREIENGQNPQLKRYAETYLPVIQDHIRIAEDLAGKMEMPGKAGLVDQSKAIESRLQAKNSLKR